MNDTLQKELGLLIGSLPNKGQELTIKETLDLCAAFRRFDLAETARQGYTHGIQSHWTDIILQIETTPPGLLFKTDGCSLWPDEWKGEPLFPWCVGHDIMYWCGFYGERMDRLNADVWLMMKIARYIDIELSTIMFNGVRLGGSGDSRAPWRWGFGRVS